MRWSNVVAILFLLVFAFAWVAGGVWLLRAGETTEEISSSAALLFFVILLGPPAWALWLVTEIIEK